MQKYSVYIFAHDHEFGCSHRQDSRVEELEALLDERDRALEAARRRLREADTEVQKAHSQRSAAIHEVERTAHCTNPQVSSAQASGEVGPTHPPSMHLVHLPCHLLVPESACVLGYPCSREQCNTGAHPLQGGRTHVL